MEQKYAMSADERLRKIQLKLSLKITSRKTGLGKATQKGFGTEFHQLRDYQAGDDIRAIDWKSSARTGKLFVKEHLQEQQYSLIILIDQSGSMATTSSAGKKYHTAQELAVIMATIAHHNACSLGLGFFTDQLDELIYPATGADHYAHLLKRIITSNANQEGQTNLSKALKGIARFVRSNTIVCVISDGIDTSQEWQQNYRSLIRGPLLFLRVFDPLEKSFFPNGIIHTIDAETAASKPLHANIISTQSDKIFYSYELPGKNKFCSVSVGTDTIDATLPFLTQALSRGMLI